MTPLLQVSNLVTEFGGGRGRPSLCAVNDVSFTVERGKVLGLVGESGSGKSVTGFSIMRLLDKPGRVAAAAGSSSTAPTSRNIRTKRCGSCAASGSPWYSRIRR